MTDKKQTKRVIWDWLPGIVAGLMPLCIFGVVSMYVTAIGLPEGHPDVMEDMIRDGWVGHLLVLSIVTSTVSTFTAYPRLFMEKEAGAQIGGGSLMFVMLNTLILILSAVLYAIHELHLPREIALRVAGIVAIFAAAVSLYLEFAISNHQLQRNKSRPKFGPAAGKRPD